MDNLTNITSVNLKRSDDSSNTGFPTGGFSHSLGLEAAIKTGLIKNREALKQYVCCCLENTGSFALPFMKEAYSACRDESRLAELDRLCEACTSNHVAKKASTRQGTSMLDTCVKVFRGSNLQALTDPLPHKHQAVVFGAVCGLLGVQLEPSMTAFLYSALRTVTASAVRLDKVGPIEAQTIQQEVQEKIPDVLNKYGDYTSDDTCIVHAHVDIVQNIHDTMFTKLFYT